MTLLLLMQYLLRWCYLGARDTSLGSAVRLASCLLQKMRLYSRLWGRHPRSKTIHKLGDCQTMVWRRSRCDFNLVRDEYVLFTMSLTRTTLPTILKCKSDVVWSVELPVTMELLTTAAKVMSESELLLPRSMVCIIFTTEPPQLHILTRCFLKKYIEEHRPKGSALLLNHYVFTSHQMFCAHDSSSSWSTWFPEFKTLSWGFSETSVEGMSGEFSHWFCFEVSSSALQTWRQM